MSKPKTQMSIIKENGEIFVLFDGPFSPQEKMSLKKFRQGCYHLGFKDLAGYVAKIIKTA